MEIKSSTPAPVASSILNFSCLPAITISISSVAISSAFLATAFALMPVPISTVTFLLLFFVFSSTLVPFVVFNTSTSPSCFCTSFGEFVMSNPSIVLRLSSPASSALYLFL